MVELLLSKKTNVYNYGLSSSGQSFIGSLIRVDNEEGYTLDLYENETIPITYEIADVKDPTVKRSPFSKNFLIPGTKRNQLAMDFAYMITSEKAFRTYNGEIVNDNEWQLPLQEAVILVDGLLAFTGKLELTRAIVEQGEVNSFEVNFLATQINIFDELENKNMRDLSLPTDFIKTGNDVLNIFRSESSDDTFTVDGNTRQGFTLAYPDWGFASGATAAASASPAGYYATTGTSTVFTKTATPPSDPSEIGLQLGYNFTQYAYVKYLLDQIFDGIDIDYSSDFFNSEAFKRLILLAYDSNQYPSNTGMKIFGSNPSTTSYYTDAIIYGSGFQPDTQFNDLENFGDTGQVPSASPFNADESLKDPFHTFDVGTQRIIFPRTGTYKIQVKAVVDIRFGWDMYYNFQGNLCPGGTPQNNVYDWANYPLLGPNSSLQMVCETRPLTYTKSIAGASMTSTSLATPNTYTKGPGTHYQWESSHDVYTVPLEYIVQAQAGDVWKFRVQADLTQYKAAPVETGCSSFPVDQRKYQVAVDMLAVDISNFFFNWNQTLPDITQKDFLVALIKHFNLYSEVTPNSRLIRMEPRDSFYNSGYLQDWTLKLDISSAREIERSDPPLEVFARMKKTDNWQDKISQETTSDELEYGSYKTFLDNGKDDTQTIQSDFGSLTPDAMGTFELVSSQRRRVQARENIDGTDYVWNIPNPSLWSGSGEGGEIAGVGARQLTEQSDMYLAYRAGFFKPYASDLTASPLYGHFYAPGATGVTGTLTSATGGYIADHLWSLSSVGGTGSNAVDVNFGGTKLSYWSDGGNIPPVFGNYDTNYERYYEGFYNNLNDQKILKAKVRLDASDIARFSFRNPVFVRFPNGDAQYFIVNKIDYDPTSLAPSTVELLTFNRETFNFSYSQVGPEGPGPDYPTDIDDLYPPDYKLPPDQGVGEFPGDIGAELPAPSPTPPPGPTGGTGIGIVIAAAFEYPPDNQETIMSVTAGGTAIQPFPGFGITGGTKRIRTLTQAVGGTADYIYAGGYFTEVNGTSQQGLLRFFEDGSLDTSWTTGIDNTSPFTPIIVDSDAGPTGSVYIVGGFDRIQGGSTGAIQSIAHLNADGTVNTSFDTWGKVLATGPGSNPYYLETIAYDSTNSKVYIGSPYETQYDGTGVGHMFRLNTDGSLDGAFDTIGTFTDPSDVIIRNIHFGATGIYVAGRFKNAGGVTGASNAARLAYDGTVDASFIPGITFGSSEQILSVYEEGSTVWLSGAQDTAGSTVWKTNLSGTRDATFAYNVPSAYTPAAIPSASYLYINTSQLTGTTGGVYQLNKTTGARTWSELQLYSGTQSDMILLTGA